MATAVPVDPSISKADLLLKALQMKAEQDQALSQTHVGPGGVAWAGPNDAQRDTQDQLSSAITDLQPDPMKDRYEGIQRAQTEGLEYNLPESVQQRRDEMGFELAKARAPEEVKAQGALALERAKPGSRFTDMLLQGGGQGGASATPAAGGTSIGGNGPLTIGGQRFNIKPNIAGNGDMSIAFEPNKMSGLKERGMDALAATTVNMDRGMASMEKLYPGITDIANKVRSGNESPSWLGYLLGTGPKYGSAMDQASIYNERKKYDQGLASPASEGIQAISFGNLAQQLGLFPGVRGLSELQKKFDEHQGHWGHETPLATMIRLLELREMTSNAVQQQHMTPDELFQSIQPPQGAGGGQ